MGSLKGKVWAADRIECTEPRGVTAHWDHFKELSHSAGEELITPLIPGNPRIRFNLQSGPGKVSSWGDHSLQQTQAEGGYSPSTPSPGLWTTPDEGQGQQLRREREFERISSPLPTELEASKAERPGF